MNALSRPLLRVFPDEGDLPVERPSIANRVRHALVCLDRSPSSEACLPHARMIAETFGAALTVTHVMPSRAPGTGMWNRTDVLEWEIERREADQYLEHARELLALEVGSHVYTALTQGVPAERIVATAREVGADLTIMASSAPLSPIGLVGGTAQRVLSTSKGSVLLAQGAPSVPPARIMVPLDGSTRAESVLPAALSLARTYGAEILLVHVVRESSTTAALADAEDVKLSRQLTRRLEKKAEQYLQRASARVIGDRCSVRSIVRVRADERRALLETAQQLHADLVVMAAHGSTCHADDAFGGVAAYLLACARVPLLVLQDIGAQDDTVAPPQAASRSSTFPRKEEA